MKDVNEAHLTGRAGKDAEAKTLSSGKRVTEFSLATGGGEKRDGGTFPTQWHNIKAWGDDVIQVRKGEGVDVIGRIEYESWDDKLTGAKRYKTVIVASKVELVKDEREHHEPVKQAARRDVTEADPITDEDIPF